MYVNQAEVWFVSETGFRSTINLNHTRGFSNHYNTSMLSGIITHRGSTNLIITGHEIPLVTYKVLFGKKYYSTSPDWSDDFPVSLWVPARFLKKVENSEDIDDVVNSSLYYHLALLKEKWLQKNKDGQSQQN